MDSFSLAVSRDVEAAFLKDVHPPVHLRALIRHAPDRPHNYRRQKKPPRSLDKQTPPLFTSPPFVPGAVMS